MWSFMGFDAQGDTVVDKGFDAQGDTVVDNNIASHGGSYTVRVYLSELVKASEASYTEP